MSRPISYFTDTHIAKAVATQLQVRGIVAVRCEEVGMAQADDESLLTYATENGHVMITQDSDFKRLHARWQERGRTHAGIMIVPAYLQDEAQISFLVRTLTTYAELIAGEVGSVEADIENQLIFL